MKRLYFVWTEVVNSTAFSKSMFGTLFFSKTFKCLPTFLFRSFYLIFLTCILEGSRFQCRLQFGCLIIPFYS